MTTMTDEQIDAAARKLCKLRGLTPEEQTRLGVVDWNASPLAVVPITHLQDCIMEIRAHLQVQEAIAYAVKQADWEERHKPQPPPFIPTPPKMPCECGHSSGRHTSTGDYCFAEGCTCRWYRPQG